MVTETEAASEETIIEETKATEEETEAKMPAAEFNGSANGVNVRVVADEGTFPEGTTMTVKAVSAAQVYNTVDAAIDGEVATIKAVDVTFYDADGKEIQPAIPVHMTMNAYGMDSSAPKEVIHIDDNGNADVIKAAAINGNQAAFVATSFSVYIVVDEEDPSLDENAVATYEFYVGEELKSTQYIKTGDTLVDPGTLGAGNGSTSIFNGWYVSEDQTISGETAGAKLAFGVKSTVPKTETIKIEAKVTTTYYVTFLGEKLNGERAISAVETVTVEGEAGTEGTLDISGVSIIPKQDTSAFKGWAELDGGAVLADSTITVTGPKTLYAVVVNAHWISFDENIDNWDKCDSDPTYTGPVYVAEDDDLSTKKPADPTRKGYTFGGWYKDTDCTEAFAWTGTGLEEDITLYARWEPAASKYTVVIWKQKVTDDKEAVQSAKTYDFEASIVLDATTHDPLGDINLSEYKNLDYTGFHYAGDDTITYTNASKEVENTVSANGDTVININYDRDLMTINFVNGSTYEYQEATDNSGTQYGLVDGEYVQLSRSGNGGNYTWSYTVTGSYSGTFYHRVNNNNGTQYGVVNGQLVQLTRQNGNWYYNGSRYYGDRYAEGEASGWNTTYGLVSGSLVALSEDWWTGEYTYTQTITYTDTRYKLASVPKTVTFTGLYGSSLASNGYEWPSDETWYQNPNSGGTRLTFLDAFKFEGLSGVSFDGTILTQYAGQSAGNNAVRFYKQGLNGNYPATATNTVYTGNNSSFTVTENTKDSQLSAIEIMVEADPFPQVKALMLVIFSSISKETNTPLPLCQKARK